jgi:site-specific recombinase XerD
MYSVSFVCPASRANRQGLVKIQLWLNVNGVRKTAQLDLAVNPAIFQKQLSSKRANNINTYCNNVRNEINTIYVTYPNYTAQQIIDVYKGKNIEQPNTLSTVSAEFVSVMRNRIGVQFGEDVYKKYVLATKRFVEWIGGKITVDNINSSMVSNYECYLRTEKKYDINTVANYLKRLKYFLNWCIENEYITSNPFRGIKIKKVVREVQYLTTEELDKLVQKEFCTDRLNKVRDLFLFACNTGLAFADMNGICRDDILTHNGLYYIRKNRQKTGVKYTVILNPTAMGILEKYNYELPLISNQKYNAYLKEIGDVCGVHKPLHSHIARHTFATISLSRGYSVSAVKEFLGHSNINQTIHYAKMMDDSLFKQFTKIEGV